MEKKTIIIWICIFIMLFLFINLTNSKNIDFKKIGKIGVIGTIFSSIVLFFKLYKHNKNFKNFKNLQYNLEATCHCNRRKTNIYPECFHCNSQPFSTY